MNTRSMFCLLVILIVVMGSYAQEKGPIAISPGSEKEMAFVAQNCPTFSWTAVDWAVAYKVAVFETRGPNVLSYNEMAAIANPIFVKEIKGLGLSWTPSSDERLIEGGMYVWYVQALNASGHGTWSEGRMFKVEAGIRLAGIEDTMKKSLREKGMSEDLIEDTIEEMRLGVRAGVAYGVDRDGSEVGTQDIFGIQGAEETYNTFYGLLAGYNNTGKYNSFFGSAAGYNTKGNDNSMMGYLAGYSNTTGDSNTFMGSHAGFKNTIGWSNTFIGQEAGYENSTGAGNVFLGAYAGYYETGYAKLYVDNTPTSSPLIWGDFGSNIVAVHGKFGIGTKSPDYQMEIETTGENAILLLDRTDGATTGFSASGDKCAFGTLSNHPLYCVINGVFTMILQTNGSLHMSSGAYCTAAGKWVDASSREYKENIQELTVQEAMDALEGLNPVKYNYKKEKGKEYVGFIAEDVPDLVASTDRKGLSAIDVVGVLTKVLQEQQAQVLQQKNMIEEQQNLIAGLQKQIDELKNREK